MNISLQQLYVAYRKAKKEAFGDTNCAHGLKFAAYEQALAANLARLRRELNRTTPTWPTRIEILGTVTCIPKSVTPADSPDTSIHYQCSDPLEQWRRQCRPARRATADFRPVINATVDFMVISALWILEVGHLYDSKLDTRYAVGNRLRRWRPDQDTAPGTPGELNTLSSDLFQPYFTAYGKWRSAGLKAMRSELNDGHRIVAVTMDLKRFYHQIDASFLLHEAYLDEMNLSLNRNQRAFTQQLINAISTWNEVANAQFNGGPRGLPVGLTASGLIANVLLRQFDRGLVARLEPVHYARYVDDVFLVLRHSERFANGEAFLRWLGSRLGRLATALFPTVENPCPDGPALRVNLPYADGSELLFVGKKQKIFQLKGQHGIDLIGPIEEQIRKQSSEFRDLPDLPDTEREMAHRALLVTSDATLNADALRKADAVTLRRSGFAMLLSDVEAHARDLEPSSWADLRYEFYGLARRHLITPNAFFDYSRYYPRIIGLMAVCGDWVEARRFVDAFASLQETLRRTCRVDAGRFDPILTEACGNLGNRVVEAVLQSVSLGTGQITAFLRRVRQVFAPNAQAAQNIALVTQGAHNLVHLDWSRMPYWATWVSANSDVQGTPRFPSDPEVLAAFPIEAIQLFRRAATLRRPYWPAVVFPTRPLPLSEITSRAPTLLESGEALRIVVMGLRGTWMPEHSGLSITPATSRHPQTINILHISNWKPKVSITILEVGDVEWQHAADGNPILTLGRYRQLNRLLDATVKSSPRPAYLILPELCLPQRWAMRMISKITQRGVSVIAGLEYRHDRTNPSWVHNEALIALRTVYPGYQTTLFLLQPKRQPAWREQQLLADEHSKWLAQPPTGSLDHPVYNHQGFTFGVLICSELTDIQNRSHFQGKVDALFVPEWNTDIESFAALVESSALDVHAYIVQANNRRFGDSRMRAPMKEHFKRDLIRVKGGLNDYFVVGEIDYIALRRFQSHPVPPVGDDEEFKPFPIGFPERLSRQRRIV